VDPTENPSGVLVDGESIRLGSAHARVRIGARRRMAISVEPDGTTVLHLPCRHDRADAERFLSANQDWIARKQRDRARLATLQPVKRLLDGEGFLVLGRSHMLRLVDACDPGAGARLTGTTVDMPRRLASEPTKAKAALKAMYRVVGSAWLASTPRPWADRLGIPEPPITIRELGGRWGSFRPDSGRILLHWSTFQLPDRLISYVLAHELAHGVVSTHGQEFWKTLRRVLPDCYQLRAELDRYGRAVWTGDLEAVATPQLHEATQPQRNLLGL